MHTGLLEVVANCFFVPNSFWYIIEDSQASGQGPSPLTRHIPESVVTEKQGMFQFKCASKEKVILRLKMFIVVLFLFLLTFTFRISTHRRVAAESARGRPSLGIASALQVVQKGKRRV